MYTINLNEQEYEALRFIASRYYYATVLFDVMEYDEEKGVGTISESDAWEFVEAVENEDGYLPLMGGSLLEKTVELLNEIV